MHCQLQKSSTNPARVVAAARHTEERAGVGQITLDACAHEFDLVGVEEAADDAARVRAERGRRRIVQAGGPVIRAHQDSSPRSLMSLATCPVALTLWKACSISPVGEMTKVERMTPVTTLP